MSKYKSLKKHKRKAMEFLIKMAKDKPELFAHWNKGMVGAFA
jgi:hypothetical protein